MVKPNLKKMMLDIGRFIGQAKRKEKDVVALWQDMLNSIGKKPADRVLELMAWDLENNLPELQSVRRIKQTQEMQQAFDDASLAKQISELAQTFAIESIKREWEHKKEIEELIQHLKRREMESVGFNPSGRGEEEKTKRA